MIDAIEAELEVVGGETGRFVDCGVGGPRRGPWVLSTDPGPVVDTGELRHRLRKRRVAHPITIKRFTPLLWVQYCSAERNFVKNIVILQQLHQQLPINQDVGWEVGWYGDPRQLLRYYKLENYVI
jgi:hypothetical protein